LSAKATGRWTNEGNEVRFVITLLLTLDFFSSCFPSLYFSALASLFLFPRQIRRARNEHASAIKAMQARHAKGLLTSAEQVRLAEEIAMMQQQQHSKTNGEGRNCLIA
jgi:hypothetical protein